MLSGTIKLLNLYDFLMQGFMSCNMFLTNGGYNKMRRLI